MTDVNKGSDLNSWSDASIESILHYQLQVTGEDLNSWSDEKTLLVDLRIVAEDSVNNWSDSASHDYTFINISTSDSINNWDDSASHDYAYSNIEKTFFDSLDNWVDGFVNLDHAYEVPDDLDNWLDIASIPDLVLSPAESLDNWLDALGPLLTSSLTKDDNLDSWVDGIAIGFTQIQISASDDLSNWADGLSRAYKEITVPAIPIVAGYLTEENNIIRKAQVTVSDVDSNYPAHNVTTLPVSNPGRCLYRNSPVKYNISFRDSESVNIIAIVGHNLTSNATITVKAGSSEDPSDSIGTISWRKGTAFVYLDALQLAQYFKLEIEDASNPDGFIDIGYICIGALTELDFTFAYGSRYSHKVAGLGDLRGDSLEIRRHLSDSTDLDLKFQNLYVTDANILRTIFQDNLGPTVPFLFIPDTTDSDCVFGRWTGEFTKQFTYTNLMNVDISIVGDATPTPISESPIIVLPGKSMPIGYNFNRASTARSKDADLRLITTTSGVIRDAYYFNQETCGILIEPERTNILAYSEDVPNWASLSIGIKTPLGDYDNLVDEPRYSPSTVGDKIVEDGSTGEHYIRSATWTSSDDTIQSCSVFLKAAERSYAQVGVRLKNGSSYPYTRVNLSTGAIEASINTAAAVEEYFNGWYRVLVSQDIGSGASEPYLYIYIGTGPSTFSYAGDNSSGIYVFGMQVEPDSLFPSSYIPTTTSSATREGDDLSVAINSTPRPMTVYAKWKDIGQNDIGTSSSQHICELGTWSEFPRWNALYQLTDYIRSFHQVETGGDYSAASVGPAPVEGDIMEARGYVRYDGKVRVGLSTNGGSESLSALGSPNEVAFTSAWGSDPYLRVGYGNAGVCGHGQFLLLSFKAVHGVQSMDYMRQLES